MMFLKSFLLFVEVATCVLMIGVILLQKTKGGGMSAIGGGVGEALFGAQMGNILTKATVVLGVIFLVNTCVLALIETQRRDTPLVGDGAPPPVQQQQAMPDQPDLPMDAIPEMQLPVGVAEPVADIPADPSVPAAPVVPADVVPVDTAPNPAE